jgi:hypothetical protein
MGLALGTQLSREYPLQGQRLHGAGPIFHMLALKGVTSARTEAVLSLTSMYKLSRDYPLQGQRLALFARYTALKGVTSTDTETVGILAALNSVLYLLLRLVRAGAWWACLPGGRGVAGEWESGHASTTGSASPPSGRLGLSIR